MIAVLLPLKTVAGLNAREHWRFRAKRVKAERRAARLALASHRVTKLPCIVRITRLSPGTLDSDNLQGAAKAIRDGVADWMGLPDNHALIDWQYAQERCKRGQFGVRVEVVSAKEIVDFMDIPGEPPARDE